jgi:hypothetical protein
MWAIASTSTTPMNIRHSERENPEISQCSAKEKVQKATKLFSKKYELYAERRG